MKPQTPINIGIEIGKNIPVLLVVKENGKNKKKNDVSRMSISRVPWFVHLSFKPIIS